MYKIHNYNSTPVDLYDLGSPSEDYHVTVKRTIEKHRNDNRKPVAFSSNNVTKMEK